MGWGGARPGSGPKRQGTSRWALRRQRMKAANGNGAGSNPKAANPYPVDFAALLQAVQEMRGRSAPRPRTMEWCPYQIAQHPPAATPPKHLTMAFDDALTGSVNFAAESWMLGGMLSAAESEGLFFLGYPFLSELAQRPEFRVISWTIADAMTSKWIKLKAKGDEDKTEKIKELEDYLSDLRMQDRFRDAALQDGLFGRAHIFLDPGDVDDKELATPIGTGRDETSKTKLGKGWLKALRNVEPVWTYPTTYNAQNPLKPDWYNPQVWYVMGKEIHRSRLPTFIGRPVPDLLKPAYSFGGLSMTQMAKPYVDIWLQTRQSVADIVRSFSIFALGTDLQTILHPGGGASTLVQRVQLFNALRDNQGMFVFNKNTEDFKNISAPLSGLHELQAQSQEHVMCCRKGTLVATDRGQVPIEKVTPEYMVMTRSGLAPVRWAGQSGTASEVIEIRTGGRTLGVTGWHPIWSETTREFVNAENVDHSHYLLALKTGAPENMASPSPGVGVGGARPASAIIGTRRLAASFSTSQKTVASTSISSNRGENRARSAETSSRLSSRNGHSIVPAPANVPPTEPVKVASVHVIKGPSEPVYNLEVVDGFLPEFFADGILVHNSVARIPATKYTGLQPTGLNATGEGELRAFDDTIASSQESLLDAQVEYVLDIAMISLFGERDPDIIHEWVPLHSLTEKERAELRKLEAETGQVHIDTGVISQEEERTRIANDPSTLYHGLNSADVPELKEEEAEGLVPLGAGKGLEAVLNTPEGGGSVEGLGRGAGPSSGNPRRPNGRGGEDQAHDAEWKEGDHPRGQSENAGQFASSGGGGKGGGGKEGEKADAPAGSTPTLHAIAERRGLIAAAGKIGTSARAADASRKKLVAILRHVEQLHDKIDALGAFHDRTEPDLGNFDEDSSVDFLESQAKEEAAKIDPVPLDEDDLRDLGAEEDQARMLKGRIERLHPVIQARAKALRTDVLRARKEISAFSRAAVKAEADIEDARPEEWEWDGGNDDTDTRWWAVQKMIEPDLAPDRLASAADYLEGKPGAAESSAWLRGELEDHDESVAEEVRWLSMSAEEQKAEMEARDKKQLDEFKASRKSVFALVDAALERGWRPEFNEYGGWERPPEFKSIASLQQESFVYERLAERGVKIPASAVRLMEALWASNPLYVAAKLADERKDA